MTFTLRVSGDVQDVTKDLDRVSRNLVPRAASSALNTAVSRVRTASIRGISGARNVPQKALRGGSSTTPGSRRRRSPRIIIRGRANPKKLFVNVVALVLPVLSSAIGNPKQSKGGSASSGNHSWSGGFVAKMKSGHVAVFRRQRPSSRVGKGARSKAKARGALPIKEQSVSLQPDASRIIEKNVNTVGRVAFRKEFERLMALRLRAR